MTIATTVQNALAAIDNGTQDDFDIINDLLAIDVDAITDQDAIDFFTAFGA